MKITTFNPQIITKNAEPLVALFKELGFEKCHNQEGIVEMDVSLIVLIKIAQCAYEQVIDTERFSVPFHIFSGVVQLAEILGSVIYLRKDST